MSIKIRLIGDLRRFAKPDALDMEGGACTLQEALAGLSRQHPRLGRELFDEQGRLHYAVVLMISGRRVMWPDDKDVVIEDGGELMLTRFHTGG